MTHQKIRIPIENATEIMFALGKLKNSIEFEDLTQGDIEAKKNFGKMIMRCDESKKHITDFFQICTEFQIPFYSFKDYAEFDSYLQNDMKKHDKKIGLTYFDLLESEISENDRKINELIDSHTQVREDLIVLIEKKHVLAKTFELIRSNIAYGNFGESDSVEDGIKESTNSNLLFLAGAVNIEHELKMKRMIFRISRGNAICTFSSLDINQDEYLLTSKVRQRGFIYGNKNTNLIQNQDVGIVTTKKKIFSVMFSGGAENILLKKILKICEIFQASRFQIPKNSQINDTINNLNQEISDKKNLLISIEKNLYDLINSNNYLQNRFGVKYSLYRLFFEEQKLIYENLNKCIVRGNFIDGRVWIPKSKLALVTGILKNLYANQENKLTANLETIELNENDKPPTFILTNSFTSAFQLVVDTYGIPRYKEVNPCYFTIITFPFLFGVMFGDIGHGSILFILGLYLCLFNEKLEKSNSVFKKLLFARYFLLLMGFFALFCGLLYNDFFSVPIYFTSCYPKIGKAGDELNKNSNCNYKFGIDPVWFISSNELTFVNSLKMKLSVILGVFQMLIGIILKGINNFYEKDFVEYIFVFIPQLIFMIILFGYMDLLIFVKWSINYNEYDGTTGRAPDIKTYLINIFIKFGNLPEVSSEDKDWILIGNRNTVEWVHRGILFLSIICLLFMLLPKIFLNYLNAKNKFANMQMNNNNINNENNMEENLIINDDNNRNININEEPKINDFIVGSVIDTIEYALGTVSNTASYLRLWALSLAHSQLSAVFFNYILGLLFLITDYFYVNGLILSVVFIIFAGITFGVLLLMDMMECFLHTLRLHWVEFQNKFYKADGYKFKPFCFEQNLELNLIEYK